MSTLTVRPIAAPTGLDLEADRTRAIRALLASPLLVARQCERDDWLAVLRQQGWLRTWFADRADWTLRVDARAGYARLEKRTSWRASDATRRYALPNGRRMSQRAFVILCVLGAELVATNARQVLVRDLASQVAERAAAEGLAPYDATRYGERQALVDALRLLEGFGVLTLDAGAAEDYLGGGDALYTVDFDLLGSLVIARGLPLGTVDYDAFGAEPEPVTDDGRRRRARQHLVQRLLDDPVVYADGLDPDEAANLTGPAARAIANAAEAAGLLVERRVEGLAAIDPDDRLTDVHFPSSGTVAHASLLACELLAEPARDTGKAAPPVPWAAFEAMVSDLLEAHPAWSDEWRGKPDGGTRLARDVADRLASFRLIRLDADGGVVPLPAITRYAADAPTGVQLSLLPGDDA